MGLWLIYRIEPAKSRLWCIWSKHTQQGSTDGGSHKPIATRTLIALSIDIVSNQTNKPAILLREHWREGKRIRKKTITNLKSLPPEIIASFRAVLKGGIAVSTLGALMTVQRSYPHGAVVAVLATAKNLGFERLLGRRSGRERRLALATIVAQVLETASKLATSRRLSAATAAHRLGPLLALGDVTGNEVLAMLDGLKTRQDWIEKTLAKCHLDAEKTLLLYDVSSSDLEGSCCPLTQFGYNRDGKKGKQQIVYGLLCASKRLSDRD